MMELRLYTWWSSACLVQIEIKALFLKLKPVN